MMPTSPPKPKALPAMWEAHLADHVIALAWSPNGVWLAAAEVSGPISLFATATGQRCWRVDGHGFGTTALAWRPDGAVLCSAGLDGNIRWWDTATGTECLRLAGGATWVEQLTWTPGDRTSGALLASGAGRKLRLWNRDGQPVQAYTDAAGTISAVHWVPGLSPADPGPPLLISAAGSTLTLWLTDRPEPLHTYHAQGAIIALAWRRDRRVIAAGKQDARVQTWTFPAQSDLMMHGYTTKVRELAWEARGHWLATDGSPVVIVWDWRTGTPDGSAPISLDAHLDLVSALAFQHHGPDLASGGIDSRVYLWNMAQGEHPLAYSKLAAPISQVAWSPDDALLAIGADDGMVRVCAIHSEG